MEILKSLLNFLVFTFKSRVALQVEIIALRHQLNVLRRTTKLRQKINDADRLLWILLYRIWPDCLGTM